MKDLQKRRYKTMKYYNIELLQTAAEKLQQLLYDLQVKFEISAAGAIVKKD